MKTNFHELPIFFPFNENKIAVSNANRLKICTKQVFLLASDFSEF